MILLLSRNIVRHNCIFASIVFSTQNPVLYKACVVDTGQSVFTRIPTWYCECPVTKNHLATSMFNGISSGIAGHAEPSTITMPNNQPHRKAPNSCQRRSTRGLTSPLTSAWKPSPQQISDVETNPKCTTRSNSRVQQRQDLAQCLHDRRTRSVMVRSTACCMTVKTWQRSCRTVRKSATNATEC